MSSFEIISDDLRIISLDWTNKSKRLLRVVYDLGFFNFFSDWWEKTINFSLLFFSDSSSLGRNFEKNVIEVQEANFIEFQNFNFLKDQKMELHKIHFVLLKCIFWNTFRWWIKDWWITYTSWIIFSPMDVGPSMGWLQLVHMHLNFLGVASYRTIVGDSRIWMERSRYPRTQFPKWSNDHMIKWKLKSWKRTLGCWNDCK